MIFVVVSGSFYAALAGAVPGLDAADPALRALVQPLDPPGAAASPAIAAAARIASVDALRLAAIVCAALLGAGAAANWLGLRAGTGDPVQDDEAA